MVPEVFHSLQAMAQAWQPTHTSRSMTNPSLMLCSLYSFGGASVLFVAAGVVAQHLGALVTLVARQRFQFVELRPGAGFARRRFPYLHAQVEPRGLTGDGIGVGDAALARLFRQQLRNQVVEQETPGGLGGICFQAPGAFLFANGVPGPDRVFLGAFHGPGLAADLAVVRRDPDPIEILDAHFGG